MLEELANNPMVQFHKTRQAAGVIAVQSSDALQGDPAGQACCLIQHHFDLLEQEHQLGGAAGVFPDLGEQVVHQGTGFDILGSRRCLTTGPQFLGLLVGLMAAAARAGDAPAHLDAVEAKLPRKVKRKRPRADDPDASEEYYAFVFPDDARKPVNLKILEMAKQWKRAEKARAGGDSAATTGGGATT